jgi:ubiquinone biosynthesis monooxygenase Coq7
VRTGAVCGAGAGCPQPDIRARFASAAREEEDHLAWTQTRLAELNDRVSLLNPLWFAGSFAIGVAADWPATG